MRKFKRIRYRARKPSQSRLFVIAFLFFTIAMVASILIVNEGIKPVLLAYSETRVKQIANQAMGIAVSKKISEDIKTEDLIQVEVDENGNVEHYIFNAVVENRVQRNVQYRVENFMMLLEQGERPETGPPVEVEMDLEPDERELINELRDKGLLIEVPIGQALGIPVLANLGPKIPVNLEAIGDVGTEVTSRLDQTGINGAYIHVNVHIEVEVRVVIPFASEPVKIEQEIPITKVFHPGEVPHYYHNGKGDSDLSLPLPPIE